MRRRWLSSIAGYLKARSHPMSGSSISAAWVVCSPKTAGLHQRMRAFAALPLITVKGDIVLLQNDWPDQYA